MIDDLPLILKGDWRAPQLNLFINAKSSERGFQFRISKCKYMKIEHKAVESLSRSRMMVRIILPSRTRPIKEYVL